MSVQTLIIIGLSIILSCLFLAYFNRFSDLEKKFGYFLLIGTFFEFFSLSCTHILKLDNNLFGLHLYTLAEFITLIYFLLESLKLFDIKLPTVKILIVGSLLIILNSMLFQEIDTYNSYSIAGVKIATIIASVYFFCAVLKSKKYDPKEIRPVVFFITAIFLNAATSTIWYLFSNEIITMKHDSWVKLSILKHTSAIAASLTILFGLYYGSHRNETDLI